MSRTVRLAPALVIMGVIFFLSAQPDLGTGLGGWDLILRKLAHMAVFGALFAALIHGLSDQRLLAATVTLAYAISDEWHQSFVSGRHGTPVDVAIDMVGVGAVWLILRRRARRREAPYLTR